jgi:hypothetical protein
MLIPMHLTLAQTFGMVSSLGCGWMMVQLGVGKRQLRHKTPARCASCGRRRTRGLCPCTHSD